MTGAPPAGHRGVRCRACGEWVRATDPVWQVTETHAVPVASRQYHGWCADPAEMDAAELRRGARVQYRLGGVARGA